MRKMFIYRYVIIILTFVLGGPTNSLNDEIIGDKTKGVGTLKGTFLCT